MFFCVDIDIHCENLKAVCRYIGKFVFVVIFHIILSIVALEKFLTLINTVFCMFAKNVI